MSASGAVWSVAGLAAAARKLLESGLGEVQVRGEIAGLRTAASGHSYFQLREAGAAVDCVLYRQNARFLRQPAAEGMAALVRARVTLYEAQGRFQLQVTGIEAEGEGELRRRIEALRARLAAEGLFDAANKRAPPPFPRVIGVVTSERGAVWHDIRTVLARRFPGARLLLAPAAVQGEGAPAELLRALNALYALPEVEVILCGRGGGALTDLMAFNDEAVVRAVAASPVPLISCVGHETDWTLCDLAADLRAPTPSAAAELAARAAAEVLGRLDDHAARLRAAARDAIAVRAQHLDLVARDRAFALLEHRVRGARDALAGARRALARGPLPFARLAALVERARSALAPGALRAAARGERLRLEPLRARLRAAARARLAGAAAAPAELGARLDGASPLRPLGRGYALVSRAGGELVRSASALAPGDELALRFADGSAPAVVTNSSKV